LLQSGYSRDFETEADSYAFARLKQIGQSPQQFAEIMQLLEANRSKSPRKKDKDEEKDKGQEKYLPKAHSVLDYLATHPVTEERIQRAMANR
jgi:predicted Zn-dependent protease